MAIRILCEAGERERNNRIINESLSTSTIDAINELLDGVYLGTNNLKYADWYLMRIQIGTKSSSRNVYYLTRGSSGGSYGTKGRFKSVEDAINAVSNQSWIDKDGLSKFKSLASKIGNPTSVGSVVDIVRDILENQLNIDDEELVEKTIEKVLKRKGQYVDKYDEYGQRLIANVDYIRDTAKQIQTGSRKL